MTKEKAEKILPVIQAIINGQKIQVNINNRWQDVDENHNCAFLPESYEYRIKPESKYRPFANAEEWWQEMQKHQPIGWIKSKEATEDVYFTITGLTKTCGVMLNSPEGKRFSGLYDYYTFADRTPFGIKEEE